MNAEKSVVLTIGHSNHCFAVFLRLLKQHDVTALADLRSTPYSRFNPHFRREPLANALKTHGIGHGFPGRELGARGIAVERIASEAVFVILAKPGTHWSQTARRRIERDTME